MISKEKKIALTSSLEKPGKKLPWDLKLIGKCLEKVCIREGATKTLKHM